MSSCRRFFGILFACHYERGPSAATAYVCACSRGLAGELGPRRESAGGRAWGQRSSCRTPCTAGSPAAEAMMSRASSSKSWRGPSAPRLQRCCSSETHRAHAKPSERQRAHVQLSLAQGAAGRRRARDPSGTRISTASTTRRQRGERDTSSSG